MLVERRFPGELEAGDTLVEILIAIVLMGIIASGSFFVISMGATTSKGQRDFVTADTLLRDSAEATKIAVRNACGTGGTTYSVAYSGLPSPDPAQTWFQYYHTARQFTLPANMTNTCPPTAGLASAQAPVVTLSVTLPNGIARALSIAVRSP